MKVIGITGKSGSGKTTFASLLAKKLNCKHIDVDQIGHEALYRPEVLDVLYEKFGTEILDENGNLDRKKKNISIKEILLVLIILTFNLITYLKMIIKNKL